MAFLKSADEENEAWSLASASFQTQASILTDEMLTDYVEHEADESVMCGKGQQNLVNQNDMFEVIDDTLSVKKVHGRPQKIPVQGSCER